MKTRPILLLITAVTVGMLMTLTIVGGVLAAAADLQINISGSSDPVTAGEILTYNVTVFNDGPNQAANVVMTTTLDTKTSFVSISPSTNCSHNNGVITCTVAALLNDQGVQGYTIKVNVDPGARGSLLAEAEVDSVIPDGNSTNNLRIKETTINSDVDLEVAHLTPQPDPAVAGGVLTYRLAITNNDSSLATGVNLILKDIATEKFEEFIAGSSGANCTGNAAKVDCNIGNVAPVGVTGPGWLTSGSVITIAVRPKSNLTTADILSTLVEIDGVEAEAVLGNNNDMKSSGVVRQSDMTVEISGSADLVPISPDVGSIIPVTYTITVTNTGPSDNTEVVVTSTYTASEIVIEGAEGAACTISAGQTVCQLGAMSDTQVKTFYLQARLLKEASTLALQTEVGGKNVEQPDVGVNQVSISTRTMAFPIYIPIIIRPSPEDSSESDDGP
ncbi:MAG: DUF11 domain-containing protein [Chloroflexi bacterium]|nr:DUF11 domain-containing protein [Chloroflexota bacterium]